MAPLHNTVPPVIERGPVVWIVSCMVKSPPSTAISAASKAPREIFPLFIVSLFFDETRLAVIFPEKEALCGNHKIPFTCKEETFSKFPVT